MATTSPGIPAAAAWLGALGLVPFIVGAAGTLATEVPWIAEAVRSYAATILAFMGGIHWGLAIGDQGANHRASLSLQLTGSVILALVAWLALLMPLTPGIATLAAAFVLLLAADLLAVHRGLAPRWYPRLRVPLTVIVTFCLAIPALA